MTREEAIKILEDERYVIWESASEKTFAMTRNKAFDMAIEALSVDLVRCGECIYRDCCSELGDEIDADDYCSFGERRSNE